MVALYRINVSASRAPSALPSQCVACLGTFDGIHLGHQRLLKRVVELKAEMRMPAVMVSFYPHPAIVLGRAEAIPKITSLRQRLEILGELGLDALYLIRFTRNLARFSAQSFVNEVLLKKLALKALVIGPDASIGREREGSAQVLKALLENNSCRCEILEFLEVANLKVSSRSIREALALGDVVRAKNLLGRSFVVEGRVSKGSARGNQLGFKTLNFKPSRQVWPKIGVYATRVYVGASQYAAVTNIGVRPTFGGGETVMETHMLNYNGTDLYGKRLAVSFEAQIREELRFSKVEKLIAQIHADIERAKQILGC